MSTRKRHERIHCELSQLAQSGVIGPEWYSQGHMPGVRWLVVPSGHTERALTTSGIEDFILGAKAAQFRVHR